MHYGRAFLAGVVGAVAMSLVMAFLRAVGIPLHIEAQLAAALGTRAWIVGLMVHLLIGGAIGIAYGIMFERILPESGVGLGVLLGAINAIFAGFAWAIIGAPGRFWSDLGAQGAIALLIAHITFGAVVGAAFKAEQKLLA